jgi:hypothetical protein
MNRMLTPNKVAAKRISPEGFWQDLQETTPDYFGSELFDPGQYRKNAELIIEKLENYLGDSSIRGLAATILRC